MYNVQRHQLVFIGETMNNLGYQEIPAFVNKRVSNLYHSGRQGEVHQLPRRLVARRISYFISDLDCLAQIFGFDFDSCLYAPGQHGAAPTGDIAGRERNILLFNDSDT